MLPQHHILLLLALGLTACDQAAKSPTATTVASTSDSQTASQDTLPAYAYTDISVLASAFTHATSGIQVLSHGTITRILSDDTSGDRHQRLIVTLSNGQTLLIAHNIDIGTRVPNPVVGTTLIFYGQYEWSTEGGTVHWTHKDPSGAHVNGWLEYRGVRYQ